MYLKKALYASLFATVLIVSATYTMKKESDNKQEEPKYTITETSRTGEVRSITLSEKEALEEMPKIVEICKSLTPLYLQPLKNNFKKLEKDR